MNVKAFVFMLSLACVSGYKVLMIAPMPIRSLNILGVGYVRHLLKAGHEVIDIILQQVRLEPPIKHYIMLVSGDTALPIQEVVTYVSPFPLKDKPTNYIGIDLSSTHLDILTEDVTLNIGHLITQPLNEDDEIERLQTNSIHVSEATFRNKDMLELLNDPNIKFDVVISDYIESEIYAALAAYYGCPMVWAYSLGSHWTILRLIDEATSPAYATDYLTSAIPPLHSMSQRMKKLWVQMLYNYYKWFKSIPREKALYERIFTPLFLKKNRPLPDYNEVIYNASLVLANDFIGNGPITSVPQNFKFIGGYHIDRPTKPLPDNLKTLLDNAEHGFIYFSMGSLWRSKDMPKQITQGLIDLFASLKHTVIWKYEAELPNLPKNVHIMQWAPQQSILAHPKCLLFISHGGLLSTTESVHFGVPTIGIPLYFDQFNNVNRAVQSGRTIKVDLTLNLIEDLRVAIQKMIQGPTYKQRAKELSQIYHDRPVSPGAELVHWVEHVVRTRGAPHLRSPASLMPWWEKLYIDVLIISLTLVLSIGYLSKKYVCCNKTVSSHKKQT